MSVFKSTSKHKQAQIRLKMSCIRCPNFSICTNYLTTGEDDEEYEIGNSDNKIDIDAIPVRDPITNKYTLLKVNSEIPVCHGCGIVYSNIENEYQNKYLSFVDSMDCCICFKTTLGVSFPNCNHYTCIPCHNRCWFGPDRIEIEFPYCDEIKKLYLSDRQNSLWKKDSKIKEYNEKSSKLEYERMDQWEREINLRKCPMCRN